MTILGQGFERLLLHAIHFAWTLFAWKCIMRIILALYGRLASQF